MGPVYAEVDRKWTGALEIKTFGSRAEPERNHVCVTPGPKTDSFEVLRKGLRNQLGQYATSLVLLTAPATSRSPS